MHQKDVKVPSTVGVTPPTPPPNAPKGPKIATNPTPVRPVPWTNPAQSNLLKRALTNTTAQSQRTGTGTKSPRVSTPNGNTPTAPSGMSQLNLQTPTTPKAMQVPTAPKAMLQNPQVWNPSVVPRPSQMTTYPRGTTSQVTAHSRARGGINNKVCKLSGNTKHDYRLGDIITIPLH
jgi:hypothetical protein